MCFDMFRAPLFDRTHILSGVPADTFIELLCGALFKTKNAYYVDYAKAYYENFEEQGKCNHNFKDIKPVKGWFPLE